MVYSNGSWTSPIATMRRSVGMPPRSNPKIRPRPDQCSSVERLCEEKCWVLLASKVVVLMPPPSCMSPPTTNATTTHQHDQEAEQCERVLVANLLKQLDAAGVPSHIMVAIISLSRKRQPRPTFRHWPTNCSPATRHSLQMPCRSAACPAHLSIIFQYLTQDVTSQARQEIIRLLTALLYLTSDEDIVEFFLCLVFDLTVDMLHEEDEGDDMMTESRAATETAVDGNANKNMRRQKSMVLQRSEFIASKIGECANLVSVALEGKVVPTVTNGIDQAGNLVKKNIPPAQGPIIDSRTAAATLTCTDVMRRSTHGIRSGTQIVSTRVRSGATTVAKIVGDCIAEEADSTDKEETKEQTEKREMLAAAGALSMATVGAVALVGESVLESGKAVLKKGTHVTADIVRHRHGDDAGQIVSDVFESTGNVLSITRTSFQATHISKAATKNIAKMHLGGG